MTHGTNKYQSRENREIVRKILMKEWDPIGIGKRVGYEDEYDNYVGTVYIKLMEDEVTVDTIAYYLLEMATQRMGLSSPSITERCFQTAKILISLRHQFESH